MIRIISNAQIEADKIEIEISGHHKNDMESDSWLSKNVRPIILIFLTCVFVLLSFADGTVKLGNYVFDADKVLKKTRA